MTGFREYYADSSELIIGDWRDDKPPPEGQLLNNVVFNERGEIIVPPKYFIGQAQHGLIEVIEATTGPDRLSGLMDYKGKWVVPMELSYFQITEPDRLIKRVRNAHFDSVEWTNPEKRRLRMNNFAHFLADYNLIGMDKADVQKLLGTGHRAGTFDRYFLITGFCGNAWTGFDIDYENDKVKRWRKSHGWMKEDSSIWVSQNMVFDPVVPYSRFKLIPKE